jgi:hypothetical protein
VSGLPRFYRKMDSQLLIGQSRLPGAAPLR